MCIHLMMGNDFTTILTMVFQHYRDLAGIFLKLEGKGGRVGNVALEWKYDSIIHGIVHCPTELRLHLSSFKISVKSNMVLQQMLHHYLPFLF